MTDATGLTIGSLFSGIGGLELGLEWAGHGPVLWQVEIDPWCRSVLARHWPGAERFDDVRTVGARVLAPVDIVCGGFPCQDVSAAGSGHGLAGARSGLWWEFRRIVEDARPPWVVVENVASGARRWVDAVRGSLGELGYETLPVPIGARDVGAPHRRNRVFLVGSLTADTDSRRRAGIGLAMHEELQRAPRHVAHGCDCARDESGRCPSPWTPVPPVRGVDDGPASKLDKRRLKALGNGVVPHCAQVAGEVINLLREGGWQ